MENDDLENLPVLDIPEPEEATPTEEDIPVLDDIPEPEGTPAQSTIGAFPFGMGKSDDPEKQAFTPQQEQNIQYGSDATTDFVVGGAYEGIRRPVETMSQIRDQMLESGLGIPAPRQPVTPDQMIRKEMGLPNTVGAPATVGVPYEPRASQTATDIGATVIPTAVGGLAVNALTKSAAIAKAFPTVMKALINTAGATAAGALAVRGDQDNILYGKGGLFEGLPEEDAEGKQNRINQYLNDVVDGLAIAFPAEGAAVLIGKAKNFIAETALKPMWTAIMGESVDAAEQRVAAQFIHLGSVARNSQTPQERQAAITEMAKLMKDNAKLTLGEGEETATIMRDTVGAIESGLIDPNNPDAKYMVSRMRALRAGQMAQGQGGELGVKLGQPAEEVDRVLTRGEKLRGGTEGIDKANLGVQKQARDQYAEQYTNPLEQKKAALMEKTSTGMKEVLDSDPGLRDALTKLNEKVNINVLDKADRTVAQMRTEVRKASDKMDEELTRLVEEIPEEIRVDFSDDLDTIQNAIDVSPSLKKKLSKAINFELDEEGNIEAANGSFKKLYQSIVPMINKEINRAGGKNVSELYDLRDLITSQVDDIPEAQAFRDYYRDEWAPIWKDGKLEEFKYLKDKTVNRGENIKPVNFETGTNKILKESLEGDPALTGHLKRVLSLPDSEDKSELITDWYIQKAAGDLQSQINSGKNMNEIDLTSITKGLEKYGANISKSSPASLERINSFLTKIRNNKGDVKNIQGEIDDLVKQRVELERAIFDDQYGEFYQKNKEKLGPGYTNFSKLMNDEGAGRKIDNIITVAQQSGDPDIVKGIQAAYMRELKSKMLTNGKIDVKKIGAMKEQKDPFLAHGNLIFKDDPNKMEFLNALVDEAERFQSTNLKTPQIAPMPVRSLADKASSAADRLITITFGVLNRVAARARSIKGMALQDVDLDQTVRDVADKFYADPEYASEVLKKFKGVEDDWTGPQAKKIIYDWIAFNTKNMNTNPVEIEKAIRQEMNGETDADTQTEEILK